MHQNIATTSAWATSTTIDSTASTTAPLNTVHLCRTPGCPYLNKSIRAKVVLDAAKAYLREHPLGNPTSYKRYVQEMERLVAEADKEHLFRIKALETKKRATENSLQELKEYLLKLKGEGGDELVEAMYREDLKAKKVELDGLVNELTATRARRENAKAAILEYETFVKLFQNIAKTLDETAGMRDLDYIMRKLFSNFTVEGKKVTNITQNSPFRELCGSPNSAMVNQPAEFWNQIVWELKQLYTLQIEESRTMAFAR